MKRKLISLTLVVAAMLVPMGLTAGKPAGGGGGGTTTYNTSWTITCATGLNYTSASINGSLQLSSRKGKIGNPVSTPCSSGGAGNTGIVTTTTSPTNWTWTFANCLDQSGKQISPITGTVGTTYATYACYDSSHVLYVSGQLTVVKK